jgi:hypothetical protein
MRGCNDGYSLSEKLSLFALQCLRLPILQRGDTKPALHFYLERAATAKASLSTNGLYGPMGFITQKAASIKKAFSLR